MARLTHPRGTPVNVTHDDNVLIGYEVVLGNPDQVFAIWLVPNSDGRLVRTRVEDTSPSATAFTLKIFNATKDLVE